MAGDDGSSRLVDTERAHRDLRLLTEVTGQLSRTLDVTDAAQELASAVVPELADFCCVDLLDAPGSGAAHRVAVSHRLADQVPELRSLGEQSSHVGGTDLVSMVASGGEPVLVPSIGESLRHPESSPSEQLDWGRFFQPLKPQSVILVPLRARGEVLGVLTLGTERSSGRRYAEHDLRVAVALAERAALAMDNARLFTRERDAARVLQRSLLPVLPEVPGLTIAARYLPAQDYRDVGGDWYDVLALPDGRIGLAVGDVVGHDLRAAAAMGQLRALVRSYAWEGLPPSQVLDRCDQLVQGMELGVLATAVYAQLELAGDDAGPRLQLCNAGHPEPLLRKESGDVEPIIGWRSPLIGAVSVRRPQRAVDCAAGDVLLCYTDGITDLPGTDPDQRQALLRRVLAGVDPDPQRLCDELLTAMIPDGSPDDVVLLAVRVD